MKKRYWLRVMIFILLFALLETVLRLLGFGDYPIYYKSDLYEYAFVPNQSLKRFGNTFYINDLGMRSAEIKPGEKLILGFGDSVLNGGVAVSQEDIASTIVDSALTTQFPGTRFTNISAGSWGVSNAFGWMMENKPQSLKAIVLVFSSHDYNDKMEFQDVVGNISFYPDSKPISAITDAVSWLYSRKFQKIEWSELPVTKEYTDDQSAHDSGWDQFIEYAKSNGLPLIVYHHADQSEVLNKKWSQKGKKLEHLLNSNGVEPVSGLKSGLTQSDFRDNIHPTAGGQRKMARAIISALTIQLANE